MTEYTIENGHFSKSEILEKCQNVFFRRDVFIYVLQNFVSDHLDFIKKIKSNILNKYIKDDIQDFFIKNNMIDVVSYLIKKYCFYVNYKSILHIEMFDLLFKEKKLDLEKCFYIVCKNGRNDLIDNILENYLKEPEIKMTYFQNGHQCKISIPIWIKIMENNLFDKIEDFSLKINDIDVVDTFIAYGYENKIDIINFVRSTSIARKYVPIFDTKRFLLKLSESRYFYENSDILTIYSYCTENFIDISLFKIYSSYSCKDHDLCLGPNLNQKEIKLIIR